jgi:hypothetical protein
MITSEYIRERIEKHGFFFTGKFGIGRPAPRRFDGPNLIHIPDFPLVTSTRGSLYIRNNYLSATGQYANLEKLVTASSHDQFSAGAPEWKGRDLMNLLDKLDEVFSAVQNPKSNPGADSDH